MVAVKAVVVRAGKAVEAVEAEEASEATATVDMFEASDAIVACTI